MTYGEKARNALARAERNGGVYDNAGNGRVTVADLALVSIAQSLEILTTRDRYNNELPRRIKAPDVPTDWSPEPQDVKVDAYGMPR